MKTPSAKFLIGYVKKYLKTIKDTEGTKLVVRLLNS